MSYSINQAITTELTANEKAKKYWLDCQAEKNWFYYKNDMLGILTYFDIYVNDVISSSDARAIFPRKIRNNIPKIVNKLASVYKIQPTREYNKEPSENQRDLLNSIYPKYKDFHRAATLLNTVLIRPIYRENNGDPYLDAEVFGRHDATVVNWDMDVHKPRKISYLRCFADANGEETTLKINWTDEYFYLTLPDVTGQFVPYGDAFEADGTPTDFRGKLNPATYGLEEQIPEDGINPYGKIPFVVLRMSDSEDFWGDGLSDIVNEQEANNFVNSDMEYKRRAQFGVPIGINLGIKAEEFVLDPYKGFFVNDAKVDQQIPSFTFATPDHKLTDDREITDWNEKRAAQSKNLPGETFEDGQAPESGYAKLIANIGVIESNEEDEDVLREFEKQFHEAINLELETSSSPTVLETLELKSVQYKEYTFPQSPDEKWLNREKNLEYNLTSVVKLYMQDNPGVTEEQAIKEIEENQQQNSQYGKKQDNTSQFGSLRTNNNLSNNQTQETE